MQPKIWITPRQALSMLGVKKLSQLTNETGQQELLGKGVGAVNDFTTPFAFGSDLKVYVDGIIAGGYTLSVNYDNGERVIVSFIVPPLVGKPVTASSTDAVNADNLDLAVLRAQGLVRGALDAQNYSVPEDDTPIVEPLLGWCAAITWYLLATDPRRPRLIEAYPELEKRYIDVYGGVDSDLKRVAKGNFSLRKVLAVLDPATPGLVTTGMTSNPQVYSPTSYRGVQ